MVNMPLFWQKDTVFHYAIMLNRFLLFISLVTLTLTTEGQNRRRNANQTPVNNGPIPVMTAPETRLLESLPFGSSNAR